MAFPASLSFLKHIGHAYDGAASGSVSGFDGVADGKVSHTFSNLAAGDYSVFVGGSDYLAQEISNPNILHQIRGDRHIGGWRSTRTRNLRHAPRRPGGDGRHRPPA